MDNNDIYTDTMVEKVHTIDDGCSDAELSKSVCGFFNEMLKRRRNDEAEGGLQLSAVIFPHTYGAKVNENDGRAVHIREHVNLTRYLYNSDQQYLSDAGIRKYALSAGERAKIAREGVEARIICNESGLLMIFDAHNTELDDFQRKVIGSFGHWTNQCIRKGYLTDVHFGLIEKGNPVIDIEDWGENSYSEIKETLGLASNKTK